MSKKQIKLLIVILLGMLGVHKFMENNFKLGLIYLCTGGLFGIGWIIDVIKTLIEVIEESNKKNNIQSDTQSMTLKPKGKDKLYDKYIKVTYTHTEGRQRLIKQLIKDDEFLKGKVYFNTDLICCDVDLEDGEMPSGKKCINVLVKRDGSKYVDHIGYITDDDEKELKENISKAVGYSSDLYVSTEEDGKYSLKIRVQMYKELE